MTRRTRSSARTSSSRSAGKLNSALIVVAVVVVVILGGIFMLTGADPLGLFNKPTPAVGPGVTPSSTLAALPTGSSGGGGDWWEVYFTDPHTINDPNNWQGSIEGKLIQYIQSAQQTIHIAAFEFNLTPVAEALIEAKGRGVEVQWITDDENGIQADSEEGHGQFAMLRDAGIEVHDDGRSALMHDKFVIFDGQILWTGATNITVNGIFENNNNVIVFHSPEVAAMYEREFADMWAGQFNASAPSTIDEQSVTIEGTPIQVLFSPEDEAVSHIVPILQGAQRSIRFMAFSFTHDDLGNALLERAQAGVDVMGIFETRGSETEDSEMGKLFCAGVPVRQDGNPSTYHHKVFVVDDEIVITGSLNFSRNADENNSENVVIVRNRDIAALFLQEFERNWAEATAPDAAAMNCP